MVANILPADPLPPAPTHPPLTLMGGVKGQNFFQNKVMLHIKLYRITKAATW